MISVSGLNDDIYTAMLTNAQEKIVSEVLTAARMGRTSISSASKGLTPTFLAQLREEGVDHIVEEDGRFKLFWEF
ncbi:hypothetical protein [Enterococcus gallinarum]|jgi:hypothetical protein|uniref:hypothetical protein n=1 Tax=Enterococcus gallinarum TaxID=1353 RepID=UPI0011DC7CA6|nr:hypothetical protein [Enterococcus gallinarum]MCR1932682.1 hypothetical protein [Enterococcus gallinarum]TXX10371.1 hypothetical protein D4M42_14065 [Enterococcus gallinarum]TXX27414.1 hypothetical protein D4M43_27205 [Escherichia coli]DAL85404.1 MAG TPA: hypothetical protein [Caudoviricetes sp.]